MNTLQYLKQLRSIVLKAAIVLKILKDDKYEADRIRGELLRNIHSIEKGLSLRNVRKCFGLLKIHEAGLLAKKLLDENEDYCQEEVKMFVDALGSYLNYHKSANVEDSRLEQVEALATELSSRLKASKISTPLGGYQELVLYKHSKEEFDELSRMIHSRHSVREFSGEPVAIEKILKAIDLARYCPSACNRQAFGVHIICKDTIPVFQNWFDGVGGFADELDKLLLVTAKISSYRPDEEMQYIVSASVLAGYLTLTLEASNIGCCFIQRPVLPTEQWQRISKQLGISQDEQIICALGIGEKEGSYKVPVSKRVSLERIVTIHSMENENQS